MKQFRSKLVNGWSCWRYITRNDKGQLALSMYPTKAVQVSRAEVSEQAPKSIEWELREAAL